MAPKNTSPKVSSQKPPKAPQPAGAKAHKNEALKAAATKKGGCAAQQYAGRGGAAPDECVEQSAAEDVYALRECLHALPASDRAAGILGALSLVLWALVIVVCVKYLLFVMRADNRGEGGIFALLALTHADRDKGARTGWFTLLVLFGAALPRAHEFSHETSHEPLEPNKLLEQAINELRCVFIITNNYVIISHKHNQS